MTEATVTAIDPPHPRRAAKLPAPPANYLADTSLPGEVIQRARNVLLWLHIQPPLMREFLGLIDSAVWRLKLSLIERADMKQLIAKAEKTISD